MQTIVRPMIVIALFNAIATSFSFSIKCLNAVKIREPIVVGLMESKGNDEKERTSIIRIRGRAAYEGTAFAGWQYQPKSTTVQGEIEAALSRRFNRTVRIVGAGRTDAGVHARGQAFHFDLLPHDNLKSVTHRGNDETITSGDDDDDDNESSRREKVVEAEEFLFSLERSLNKMISRPDIQIYNLSRAPMLNNGHTWHAIASAERKLYSYRIVVGPVMDPMLRYTTAHVHDPLFNLALLPRVLQYFEGTHDFRAFSGAVEQNAKKKGMIAANVDTIRTVYRVGFEEEGVLGVYRIDIELNGALYKMVRNIVGTAFDVCRGAIKEDVLLNLLHNKEGLMDRNTNPCKPAPPEGLTLEKVFYSDNF